MTIKIVSVNKNKVFEWRNAIRRVYGYKSKESDVERLVKDRLMIQINDWTENNNNQDMNRLIAAYDDKS